MYFFSLHCVIFRYNIHAQRKREHEDLKEHVMDKETLNRLIGLLGLTSQELAEASGYSASMINAVRTGKRAVSPRLEKIIIGLLVQRKDDPAVRIVVENCK